MPAVAFDYAVWAADYPELSAWVTEATAISYFRKACLRLNNTDASIVRDLEERALLLGMLTAHIAKLNACIGGSPPSGLVGRISNATEGSVSVQAENLYPPGTPQWYQSTPYGADYWEATDKYRRARYVQAPPYPGSPPWP